MNKVISIVMLAAMATVTSAGAARATESKVPVSREQYRILINQCRYAGTKAARDDCRSQMRRTYTIGARNPDLHCRTYSGVAVCGTLKLNERQRACVRDYAKLGLTYQRAEVECYAFIGKRQ